MATFNHIGGAEPSTLTFKLATVTQTRNSSAMHQEIMALGDPDTSNAIAAVLNAVPASTAWGLVVRDVQSRYNIGSTAADNAVSISGNSTAIQGTNPWVVGFPAGYISSAVQAGGSSAVTVRNVWSSTNADQPVSAAQAGTWNIGTVTTITTVSAVTTVSSVAGIVSIAHLDSSNAVVKAADSVNNALRVNVVAGAAGGSTIVTVSALPLVSSAVQNSNSSALSVRIVGGVSSAVDFPARVNQGVGTSSGVDAWAMASVDSSNAIVKPGDSANNALRANIVAGSVGFNLGALQSSAAGSSNSSAMLTRPIIDTILTVASSNAFASTSLTIQSSAAGIRSYVTAYSILSTAAGPTAVKFYDGSSMIWPIVLAAVSSAVSGANLAVSAPAYLFRGSQANALTLQVASSVAGFKVAVSYFRAP